MHLYLQCIPDGITNVVQRRCECIQALTQFRIVHFSGNIWVLILPIILDIEKDMGKLDKKLIIQAWSVIEALPCINRRKKVLKMGIKWENSCSYIPAWAYACFLSEEKRGVNYHLGFFKGAAGRSFELLGNIVIVKNCFSFSRQNIPKTTGFIGTWQWCIFIGSSSLVPK